MGSNGLSQNGSGEHLQSDHFCCSFWISLRMGDAYNGSLPCSNSATAPMATFFICFSPYILSVVIYVEAFVLLNTAYFGCDPISADV